MKKKIKVHVLSETDALKMGSGVRTAYKNMVRLLRSKGDVEVKLNDEVPSGWGDVVVSHTYGPKIMWQMRKYKKERRIFLTHVVPSSIQGSLPFWKQLMPIIKVYFMILLRYMGTVIALAPLCRDEVSKLSPKTNVVIIPNPIPLKIWERTEENRRLGRDLLGVGKDEFLVLACGQLQGRKGTLEFIEICKELRGMQCRWVGGRPFGKLLTEGVRVIDDAIAKSPKHIKFMGEQKLEDMPKFYAAADVLLFLSYQENCPLVPIEAAASGIPVIFRWLKEYEMLYNSPYINCTTNDGFVEMTKRLAESKKAYAVGVEWSKGLVEQFEEGGVRKRWIELFRNIMSKKEKV